MPSLREQRLTERVNEIRPQLQRAREIAEKADAEHREMMPAEQADYDDIMKRGREVSDAVKGAGAAHIKQQRPGQIHADVDLPVWGR